MYRPHGFQDKDQLLEALVKDDSMTFFPEFNLLAVTSSFDPSEEPETRQTKKGRGRTTVTPLFGVSWTAIVKVERPTFYFRPVDRQAAIGFHTLNRI